MSYTIQRGLIDWGGETIAVKNIVSFYVSKKNPASAYLGFGFAVLLSYPFIASIIFKNNERVPGVILLVIAIGVIIKSAISLGNSKKLRLNLKLNDGRLLFTESINHEDIWQMKSAIENALAGLK